MSKFLYTAIESNESIGMFFSIAILWAKVDLPDAVVPVRKYSNLD